MSRFHMRDHGRNATLTALALTLSACGSQSEASAAKQQVSVAAAAPQNGASAPPAVPRASEPLPKHILAWAEKMRGECRSVDGKPLSNDQPEPEVVADFNGDGRQDYVIADGFMGCDGALTYFTSGQVPNYTVFISTAKAFQEAAISSLEVKPAKLKGRDVLILSTGGPGAYERPFDTYAVGWNGREMADLEYYDAKGQRVNADGTKIGGGGWAKSVFPDIPKGFYALDGDCRTAGLYLTDKVWAEDDGSSLPIAGIERNGPVRYRFKARFEDEAGNAQYDFINISVTSGASFNDLAQTDEGGFKPEDRRFSYCEARDVPASIRRELGSQR